MTTPFQASALKIDSTIPIYSVYGNVIAHPSLGVLLHATRILIAYLCYSCGLCDALCHRWI